MSNRITTGRVHLSRSFIFVSFILLFACSSTKEIDALPVFSLVMGKSKTDILACAGHPYQEAMRGDAIILGYYKEEALLDRSNVVSKGSFPEPRHSCWANLLLENDHVTGVEFWPVPDTVTNTYNCQSIFEACGR